VKYIAFLHGKITAICQAILARKDEEIKECESFYEDMAFPACKELIERFEVKNY
jgi:hypothetical protein